MPAEIPAHLGGDVVGGDPATFFPGLWTWLVEKRGFRSVLDVGCGEGVAVEFFRNLGIHALGIDGVERSNPAIVRHDYATGPLPWSYVKPWPIWLSDTEALEFDLVWCCEFVEHVEERYLPNFLPTLAAGRYVLLTHAEPGQGGHHHVNCRTEDYWVGALATIGFELDREFTARARALAAANINVYNHFVRSGLAFRRYLG